MNELVLTSVTDLIVYCNPFKQFPAIVLVEATALPEVNPFQLPREEFVMEKLTALL
jgi:hypothetical protein